jgi:two-component system sensor kinase FixL
MAMKVKKTRNFRSLTVTLAIAFLSLSAIVLLIAGSLDMYFNFQSQQKLLANEQRLIAQNAANRVGSFIQEKLRVMEATISLGNFLNIEQQGHKIVLEKLLGLEPAFRQLVLLDAQKQEIERVSRLSNSVSYGFTRRVEDDLFSLKEKEKTYISSVYIDEITSEPMVVMAVAVRDVFGDFKGILLAEVNLKFMWDLVGRIKVGKNGLAYVVDRQGNLIAFGDISRVLRGENLAHLDEVNEFIKGDELSHKDITKVTKGIRGTKVVTNHALLDMPNWAVVVELPILEAYKPVITALVMSVLILLLSFALAIVAGIYLSRRITKPIVSLRDAAIKIGEGKLDTQIEVHTRDEIGDLAGAFNQMSQDLQRTTTSIDNLNREIAVRKRVEEALRKAEEKYRTQFEGAIDAIFVAEAETGILTDCNPAATRLVGREKSELIGQHQCILHPPEKSDGDFSKTFKQHLEEKLGLTIETQVITKTGEIRDVAITASLIEIRGKKLLQGIFRDVTEQKKTEQALKDREQFLSSMFSSIQDGISILGTDLSIIRVNSAMEKWYAHEMPLAGKKCYEAYHGRNQPCEGCPSLKTIETGESTYEVVAKRGEGGKIVGWLDLYTFPMFDPVTGQLNRVIEYVRDITDRKKAEEKQAELIEEVESVNRELKDFAYIVSHDLKAPLRGIDTLAKWISTDYANKFDQDGKEQMSLLLSRVDRMHNLIDGILQYSRVGRVKEEKVQVNLNELVPDIIDLIAPPENITITVENELPVIECDKTRISQVFQNLLSNAVKYMDKPEGHIKIGCTEEENCWRFSVTDNGPGIEEKYFDKIFQMFQTLSRRDDVESTGVGLTVVKKIIEMYGGTIWVESKVGEGSTFFFIVPKQETAVEEEKVPVGANGRA